MANEAVRREIGMKTYQMTVADGTAITKGAVLKMTDPRTAILADGDGDVVAGIAAADKIASDGRTTLAVYRDGIYDMVCSGAVPVGAAVVTHASSGGDNIVAAAGVNAENILGTALETGSEGETIQVELNPFMVNLA